MQYIYVRTKSILDNSEGKLHFENIDINKILDNEAVQILKNIYEFQDVLISVTEKNEPYLLARYLIELSKNYSQFYNTHKILVEDEITANARLYLTYMVNLILRKGAKILGIDMPDKM